jgi:Dyp-type peroxidase family
MESIELLDTQAYLISGYRTMQCSKYLLLQITDAEAAGRFLHDQHTFVTDGKTEIQTFCMNLAFTVDGLRMLGLNETNIQNFTREFREGMTTPHRQRLLGDFDSSAPEKWNWGGPANEPVHILMMIFGIDQKITDALYVEMKKGLEPNGLRELMQLDGQTLPGNKEHFGYRDGISQPVIKGSGRTSASNDYLNAGEFLMGYKNEYDVYPDTPLITEPQGDMNLLPADAAGTGYKDLGRNGTYMVLRQMQQHVEDYWTFMNDQTKNADGTPDEKASRKLSAKMMGRWPSGAPVSKWPDEDPVILFPDEEPSKFVDDNNFMYHDEDPHGLKCPFGSHIRRTNPRDSFEENGKKESLKLSNRHRIIRRARLYGEPIAGSATNFKPAWEVGLLFTCFNADISRQFEFIQYTWANYPKFKQLYNDPDPLIGVREHPEPGQLQNFTIPEEPVCKTITGLKRFVTIRGGAYFFFPSISAIRYLATLKKA